MTVVLGLRCAEGLVLTTDSQATAQEPGNIAIRSEVVKIEKVGSHLVFGSTGSAGCIQRVRAALDDHAAKLGATRPCGEIAQKIHDLVNPIQKAALQAHVPYMQGIPPETYGGIFCGLARDGPWMMEIVASGAWEFKPERASTGSAYPLADLAMGFVAHHDVTQASMTAAQVLAFRAIETTCNVSAFGVGIPVQMAVVDADGARILAREDRKVIEDSVNLWRDKERSALADALGEETEPSAGQDETAPEGLDEPEPEPEAEAPNATSEPEPPSERSQSARKA
jgi:proteasome beta subunit